MGGTNGYHKEDIPQCDICGIFLRNDIDYYMNSEVVDFDGNKIIIEELICEDCEGMEDKVKFYAGFVGEKIFMAPNKRALTTMDAIEVPEWMSDRLHDELNDDFEGRVTCFEVRKLEKRK